MVVLAGVLWAGAAGGVAPGPRVVPAAAPPTSEAERSSCRLGCGQMTRVGCSSGPELERCLAGCESAGPRALALFSACAASSICDDECRAVLHVDVTSARVSCDNPSACAAPHF